MDKRPILDNNLDGKTFMEYYYLKEELVAFCRKNNLQITGGKLELKERIVNFLDTGKRTCKTHVARKKIKVDEITLDTIIEEDFVCSEKHRVFYKEQIGNSFFLMLHFKNG